VALKPLVDAAKGGLVPEFVKAGVEEGRGLDAVIGWVAQGAMGGDGEGRVEFVKGVLLSHGWFHKISHFRSVSLLVINRIFPVGRRVPRSASHHPLNICRPGLPRAPRQHHTSVQLRTRAGPHRGAGRRSRFFPAGFD
jgi:hypothetical protein